MGYDMQMLNEPTDVPEGTVLQNPESPGYHRFNIRAMPITIGAMEWAQCISYATPNYPDFPFEDQERGDQVFFFVMYEDEAKEEGIAPPNDEERQQAEGYLEAFRKLTDTPGADGVPPSYKFESNEGWLVTPEECLTIANGIDEHLEMIAQQYMSEIMDTDDGRKWLTCWANYNRLASTHGGYRVY